MSRKTKGASGGSRNKAKDEVDIDHLCDLWLDLHRKNFDVFGSFGEYKGLWAECAARADLVELIPMARVMCTCSPSLMIGYSDLKEAALMTMNKDISTKPLKEETVQECSRFVADKFVVVQKHFRAISLNKDWKSKLNILMGKLSVNKQNKLQEFVDQLQEASKQNTPCSPKASAKSPKGSARSSSAMPVADEEATLPLSQVSQDDYGLPKLSGLASESEADVEVPNLPVSKQEIRNFKSQKGVSPLKRPASQLQPGSQFAKKPAARAEKLKIKKEAKPTFKRPASKFQLPAGSPFAAIFCSQQSYICFRDGGSKKLWVAISAKQSANHAALIKKILEMNPASKQQALDFRSQVLEEQP